MELVFSQWYLYGTDNLYHFSGQSLGPRVEDVT
jgi:hypothetical protein